MGRRTRESALWLLLIAIGALTIGSAQAQTNQRRVSTDQSVLLTINADGGSLAGSPATSVSAIPYGGQVTITLTDPTASGPYLIAVPASSGETVSLLPDGGAAVTTGLPDTPDVGPAATDQTDSAAADVSSDASVAATVDSEPDTDTNPGDNPSSSPDPTAYPDGASVAPPTDGTAIVDDALQSVSAADVVIAAATTTPEAEDATGVRVPSSFSVGQGGLSLNVAPSTVDVYPLEVSFSVGFNADYQSTVASVSNARLQRSAASCGDSSPSIVVSYVTHWKNLSAALVKDPTPCASYYVLVPAAGMLPYPGAAANVLKLNQRKRVESAQATFIPVATFNYYALSKNALDTEYRADGAAFAALLGPRGYRLWGVDEAPAALVQKKAGNSSWRNFVALVEGLSSTGDRGVVEDAVQAQSTGTDLKALKQYKRSVKGLLDNESGQPQFDWQTVASNVVLWAQETYTYCDLVCANGASLSAMATHTNQYVQHFGRLAFAPDAPSTVNAARGALGISYLPLTNDWKGDDNFAYQTGSLDLAQVQALASLQIYATRAWAGGNNAYSGPRIGLRWTDNTVGFSTSEQAALAARIASSLEGAYGPGGTAVGACDPTGAGITANCIPSGVGGSFTPNWSIFRLWGARRTQGVSCNYTGGTDVPGGPVNDNFDSAQVIDPTAPTNATGTLIAATTQPGESTIDHVDGLPDPTQNVWFCWTAPDVPYCAPAITVQTAPTQQAPAVVAWTGDDFVPGGLQLVGADFENGAISTGLSSTTSSIGFDPSPGTQYLIEVADAPGYPVTPNFSVIISTFNCFWRR